MGKLGVCGVYCKPTRTSNIITNESVYKAERMAYSISYYLMLDEVNREKSDMQYSTTWFFISPNAIEEFTYDANGNEIKEVIKYDDGTENITESTYNDNGKNIKIRFI